MGGMGSRVSLANKCLAIFGTANVIIITVLLGVLWMSSSAVVQDYQLEVARQLAEVWIDTEVKPEVFEGEDVNIHYVKISEIKQGENSFVERALTYFEQNEASTSEFYDAYDRDQHNYFQYAKPIMKSQKGSLQKEGVTVFDPEVIAPSVNDTLKAILVIRRKSTFAKTQLDDTRTLIIIAGIVGSSISVLVYYFIFKRLIFSPVRRLRRVSERVRKGDLTARSSLQTGDEFEELSIAFNEMLNQMEQDSRRLQKMNESLDLKVEELAEVNVGLFESGRLKNAFIANVSHELRTPLNSIIGFAEILEGMSIKTEDDEEKRVRYLRNILKSGRSLLDMINELLDMAKIESGRMEVTIEPTSIMDLLEGLVGIMRPQSKVKNIHLELDIEQSISSIQTDAGKLQQILYNYLSNAIKFSPIDSKVIVSAKRIREYGVPSSIRIQVKDNGPGIPEDMLEMVFEKFRQVDATHTREHSGTGLGLAICRELADLLHSTLGVESAHGMGSSFYVDVPEVFASESLEPLMPE